MRNMRRARRRLSERGKVERGRTRIGSESVVPKAGSGRV